jgi:hypothetical protein
MKYEFTNQQYTDFLNAVDPSGMNPFVPSDGGDNIGFRLAAPVAVPEPSTYAMALAGLACGGYSMRRRKRAWHSPTTAIPTRGEQVAITGLLRFVFLRPASVSAHNSPHGHRLPKCRWPTYVRHEAR